LVNTNSLKRNNWIVTYMKTKVINKEGEGFNHGNFETSGEGTRFIENPLQHLSSNKNSNYYFVRKVNLILYYACHWQTIKCNSLIN
jgi:hypothetical protein